MNIQKYIYICVYIYIKSQDHRDIKWYSYELNIRLSDSKLHRSAVAIWL